MTIYDVPNIEHCTVIEFGNYNYKVTVDEGWYIHFLDSEPGLDENENPTVIYKTVAIIRKDFDFTRVEIVAEADLPDNAEICGDTNNDHVVA